MDEFDDWPGDYNLTLTCRPNKKFNFPDVVWKEACKSWCPADKPTPPPDTKLVYVEGSDPETGRTWAGDRELWAGESITYGCIDGTEGIDGGDSTTVSFPCRGPIQ